MIMLNQYLKRNVPKELIDRRNDYWWGVGLRKPRKQWLKEHVKLTKPKVS